MDSGKRDDEGYHEFVEVDPTGRYGRYDEVLGKGASKTVYRAFDEYEGIEVAWNQVKLYDLSQSPEDLERLYREIHLLKTLKHENIMKFYTSWVDTTNRNINFVTEMFTSGTLRQYRLKHRKVNIRAVKHWCRQILKGLLYLHSQDPPVIHRDLKCDNIFINGNQGEVKIGDLGLAAILQKSHAAHCVGTPEFMAPEVYAEDYNELVDIYSFGMCILEMVTFEYPYSECTHTAQIYRRVVSGKKPDALDKVKDPEVRQFVEKCLASVSLRLPARELLKDPFLQIDDYGFNMKSLKYEIDYSGSGSLLRQPCYGSNDGYLISRLYTDSCAYDLESDLCYRQFDDETSEINVFGCQEDDNLSDVDITIRGRRREDGIFLRLRIADKEGRVRNIYFPFDMGADTALSVATEMVAELDIIDHDVMQIADMIDGEIASLVPEWKRRSGTMESPHCSNTSFSEPRTSDGSFQNHVSSNGPCAKNLQVLRCSISECEPAQGRFEEITYQIEGSDQCASGQGSHCDIWAQLDKADVVSSGGSRVIHSNGAYKPSDESNIRRGDIADHGDEQNDQNTPKCLTSDFAEYALWDDYQNEIRQELRWLKAKYQLQMRELKSQQLQVQTKISSIPTHNNSSDIEHENDGSSIGLSPSRRIKTKRKPLLIGPSSLRKQLASCSPDLENLKNQMCQDGATISECHGPADHMFTANDFYKGLLHPQILHRATSLPVDAIDV